MPFHDYRTAARIRLRVCQAQADYAEALRAALAGQQLTSAAEVADAYIAELKLAAEHLERHPRTAAILDLGALRTTDAIDAHIGGLAETAARWRSAA